MDDKISKARNVIDQTKFLVFSVFAMGLFVGQLENWLGLFSFLFGLILSGYMFYQLLKVSKLLSSIAPSGDSVAKKENLIN